MGDVDFRLRNFFHDAGDSIYSKKKGPRREFNASVLLVRGLRANVLRLAVSAILVSVELRLTYNLNRNAN